MTMTRIILLAALTLATSANAASVENGRKLFDATGCYQCHGHAGQGGSAGPKLAPEPLPLEALRDFIRNTDKQMPPYPASILSDAEVADIHAYLASLPATPKADSLPLLQGLK